MGQLLRIGKRIADSMRCFQRAAQLRPDSAAAHFELAVSCQLFGQHTQAIAAYQAALRLDPIHEQAYVNLGNALMESGALGQAIQCLEYGRERLPHSTNILNNLGYMLRTQGRLEESEIYLRLSVEKNADPFNLNNLGITLSDMGKLDEAVEVFQRCLQMSPNFAGAHSNLGNVFKDQGLLDEAIAEYRAALEWQPRWMEVHSNLLCTINPHSAWTPQQILEEHRRWDHIHAKPLAQTKLEFHRDRRLDRPLRVGYVSPDLKAAPVGRFMMPVYSAHDPKRYVIYTYSSTRKTDSITERCRRHSAVWRDVAGVSDEQLTSLIRNDEIDILVDLTMHMIDHRLLVFARRAAPIQATYLAYGGTTGLSTMDYRITDSYLDPPGQNDSHYSERCMQLDGCYWCYEPLVGMPEVRPRPVLRAGEITFGCLNNFCKVSIPTLETWSRLLKVLPGARLILHAQPGSQRERVMVFMEDRGVDRQRIEFVPILPGNEYFEQYHRIDIALDTFPFCGGTTTCDALWMGVPVISLAGPRAVNRSGYSLLSSIGLGQFVLWTPDDYVQKAVALANDVKELNALSATMRERMQASRLMDANAFTRDLESVYRRMWFEYLQK